MALVTEIVAPYRVPVFERLSRILDGGLEVFFIAETEARRSWQVPSELQFRHQVLGGLQLSLPYRGDRTPVYLSRPLLPRLLRGRFDVVVVGGWNHLECYHALAWSRLRRRPFVFWSETPLVGRLARRPARNALKRAVVAASSAFVTTGPSGAAYLRALGAPAARIHVAPNAVDNDFWSRAPEGVSRSRLPVLLFAGRLIGPKGIGLALDAFARSRLAGRARFVVAGDGPDRMRLEAAAPAGVEFVGSVDPEQLLRLYHSSDVLVFPSLYDPWGLVVNEASCAGLPVLGSDGAGVIRDLVVDGENGLVVPSGDRDALVAAFDRIADEPELLARLAERADEIAARATPDACARGFAEAIRAGLEAP